MRRKFLNCLFIKRKKIKNNKAKLKYAPLSSPQITDKHENIPKTNKDTPSFFVLTKNHKKKRKINNGISLKT